MTSVEDVLAGAAALVDDGRGRFCAPAPLQSWPGLVHGGGLVAILDAAAARLVPASRPRALEARLTAPVPLDTALAVEGGEHDGAVTLSVMQDGTPLTSTTVRPLTPGSAASRAWAGGVGGFPLPVSDQCLACGAANPLGLRVGLRFDESGVWARLEPGPAWVARDGGICSAVAPVILDEVAWWLGALSMREGGLTNRIAVVLAHLPVPADAPLVAAGRFADVEPIDRRRAFWRTISTLQTEGGQVLATATIVFRGGPEYSGRQLAYFDARTRPEIFRRMFPNYAP